MIPALALAACSSLPPPHHTQTPKQPYTTNRKAYQLSVTARCRTHSSNALLRNSDRPRRILVGAAPSKPSGKSLAIYVPGSSSAARTCSSSRSQARPPLSANAWRTRTPQRASSPLFDFAQTGTPASHPRLTASPASAASAKLTGLMQARQLIFDGLLESLSARIEQRQAGTPCVASLCAPRLQTTAVELVACSTSDPPPQYSSGHILPRASQAT